jgi:predicted acyl esterase
MGDDASVFRTTVRIPTASGDDLEAWVYQPEGHGPHPAVVMAHGFAGVKAGGLEPFAERFCREGFIAVAFDYRHWGGSSGEPREVTSIPRQREDYRTVINWAAANPDIDAQRIFIWGTSFSGMHVVEIAATDVRLRGAIAQCPLVDGLAGTKNVPAYSTATSALGRFARQAWFTGWTPSDLHHRERSAWRVRRNRWRGCHRRPDAHYSPRRYGLAQPCRRSLSTRYRRAPTSQEGSQHPLPDPNDRGRDRHNRADRSGAARR